ncbi:unnamed protein product (mitochondrion) [Plasmodiophora brassicae]|uniref:Tyrosine-protein phosphatase domain-containing protein n=1 Tax=Plasmodiophora brassicae TaxID=37360 RepID=A0A0G4J6D0_PLABS|nr:hypothetical protein PBRA_009167 [Plasmodiophora brassicae]SPR01558.1 unnamed protein product [Plasmodiophora brassicae]
MTVNADVSVVESTTASAVDSDVFYLEENGQLILPYVPPAYLNVNSAKILDGLFIGNKDAATDLEFITSNKITHIINCVGHLLPSSLAKLGVQYLNFQWIDAKTTVMFDADGKTLMRIVSFIQSALANHNGILIFSIHGKSRSCCVAAAFLMHQFSWSLQKALEFIQFKRPDVNPKPYFLRQLRRMEKALLRNTRDPVDIAGRWLDQCASPHELVARNTFLNGHYIKAEHEKGADFKVYEDFDQVPASRASPASTSKTLRWIDEVSPDTTLERSSGKAYSTTPTAATAEIVSILKTRAGSGPRRPPSEVVTVAEQAPVHKVKSAWNMISAGEPMISIRRPSSAQSDVEDQQAHAMSMGWRPRSLVGRVGSAGSALAKKYRKSSTARASSMAHAATVSSLAKVKNAIKYRTGDVSAATPLTKRIPSSTVATTSRARNKGRSTPVSVAGEFDDPWLGKFARLTLKDKRSLSTTTPSAPLSVSGTTKRPLSASAIKHPAASSMRPF